MLKNIRICAGLIFLGLLLGAWTHGNAGSSGVQMEGIKRVGVNGPIIGTNIGDYIFINRYLEGNSWVSRFNGFVDGVHFYNGAVVNAAGYPTSSGTQSVGGGFYIPGVAVTAGPYCYTGVDTANGTNTIALGSSSWTVTAGVSCAVTNSSGVVTGATANCPNNNGATLSGGNTISVATSGGYWCLGLTLLSGAGASSVATEIQAYDGTLGSLRVYNTADAADLAAGKMFRQSALQIIANAHLGVWRAMQWNGDALAVEARWDQRSLPTTSGVEGLNPCRSAPYTALAGTDTYTLAGAAASGCSQVGTPGATQNGEYLVSFITNAPTTLGGGGGAGQNACVVSNLTTGATTTVTTAGNCLAVGQSGMTVKLYLEKGNGTAGLGVTGTLANLDLFPVTATFVNATNFTVNFNSTGTGGFSCDSTCIVAPQETLNVGGRGAFCLAQQDGYGPINFNAEFYPAASTYRGFLFDKSSVCQTDGAGNAIQGAWLVELNGAQPTGMPIEWQVEFINELNALYGPTDSPTHLWLMVPGRATISSDPDTTSGSNWVKNLYNTVMNGANGFAGLCAKCGVFFELSNETWAFCASACEDTFYYERQGWLRWAAVQDISSFFTLRSILVKHDIQTASAYAANASRTRFILPGQAGVGATPPNTLRLFGGQAFTQNFVNTDGANPLNGGTTFTGAISGTTLTIMGGTLSGPFGLGYSIMFNGGNACVVTAGSGLSWTVQSNAPATSTTLGACTGTGNVSMTAAIAPMADFDKVAIAPYFDMQFRPTTAVSIAASGNTYNSGTGAVALTLMSALANGTYPCVIYQINGTGADINALNGYWSCTVTGGTALAFTGLTGKTVSTITGGSAGVAGADYTSDISLGATDWTLHGSGSSQVTADITTYVSDITGNSINCATNNSLQINCNQQVLASMAALVGIMPGNKEVVSYEGGLDSDPGVFGPPWSNTLNSANFVNAVYSSSAWAAAELTYFQAQALLSHQALPNVLLEVCNQGNVGAPQNVVSWQWTAGACPDTYTNPAGTIGVEGSGMSPLWLTIGTFNAGQTP